MGWEPRFAKLEEEIRKLARVRDPKEGTGGDSGSREREERPRQKNFRTSEAKGCEDKGWRQGEKGEGGGKEVRVGGKAGEKSQVNECVWRRFL